jgi:hypothetical protein
VLGCRHLLSHGSNGIEIQTYAVDSFIVDWRLAIESAIVR